MTHCNAGIRALVSLAACLPMMLDAQDVQRARGAPPGMTLVASTKGERTVMEVVLTDVSFTTDSRGRLLNTGGNAQRERDYVTIYDVFLYVDSAAFREAVKGVAKVPAPLAPGDTGRRRAAALHSRQFEVWEQLDKDQTFHDLVRRGQFAKTIKLVAFTEVKARHMRQSLSEVLRKMPPGTVDEVATFTGFIRKDLVPNDTIEIRFGPGRVSTIVAGQPMADIADADFATALASAWLPTMHFALQDMGPLLPPPPPPPGS
jgi:hypothetical protein